jgi:NADH:ubiquinone oxidoreductase subunit
LKLIAPRLHEAMRSRQRSVAQWLYEYDEFSAKNDEVRRNWERQHRQELCNRIFHAMGSGSLEPALQAGLLEKSRNLGCLR